MRKFHKVSLYFTKFHKVSRDSLGRFLRCRSKVVPLGFFPKFKTKFFPTAKIPKFLNRNFKLTQETMQYHVKRHRNFQLNLNKLQFQLKNQNSTFDSVSWQRLYFPGRKGTKFSSCQDVIIEQGTTLSKLRGTTFCSHILVEQRLSPYYGLKVVDD